MPWNQPELALEQNAPLPCSPPQTASDTHVLQCDLSAYKYAGAVQDSCYKLEISTRFGTCIAVTDLSFIILSWWPMRSCLNPIALIYERGGCKFGYFPWGFSESNAFPAFSLSERAFPVACKGHLIFRVLVGHLSVMALVGSDACVDYHRGRRTIALLCGKFIDLLQSVFIREIFALSSLIFSGRASVL